ncbi:MAG: sensor histidine kinase [Candidatus Limnocylindria bacterium]
MARASVGDLTARVDMPEGAPTDDLATRFAIALNLLLDDLALRSAEAETAHRLQVDLAVERERSARAADLARLNLDLEEANRELESFSYSVAHDLRAPLRAMDGFSQALLRDHGGQLDETGSRHLRFVSESAQEMGRLIDDLLRLSRVSRTEVRRERFDLSAAARAVAEDLQRSSPDRRVEVAIQEGLVANGDPRLLAIALGDLIGNAWKFTRTRAYPRIEVGAFDTEGRQTFFVRDNGVGFDMAYAGKLFGVFERLHPADEFEGTGIGLATVQRIVRRHGGRAWAEGEPDWGATFYFTLEGLGPAAG